MQPKPFFEEDKDKIEDALKKIYRIFNSKEPESEKYKKNIEKLSKVLDEIVSDPNLSKDGEIINLAIEVIRISKSFLDDEAFFKLLEEKKNKIKDGLKKMYKIFNSQEPESEEYKKNIEKLSKLLDDIVSDPDISKDGEIINLAIEVIKISRIFPHHEAFFKFLEEKGGFEYLLNDVDPFLNCAKRYYTPERSNDSLHPYLYDLLERFDKDKRLVVSAPPSFGKTKLFFEILKANEYKKVMAIFPTNALVNEIYQKISSSGLGEKFIVIKTIDDYESIKNKLENENFILIFTPEKALEILNKNESLEFCFGSMDEIQKIDYESKDQRAPLISNALYKLADRSKHLYCIGPSFDHFEHEQEIRAQFERISVKLVSSNTKPLLEGGITTKKKGVFNCINHFISLNQTGIIYCPRIAETESLATSYAGTIGYDIEGDDEVKGLINYINKEILEEKDKDKWHLIKCLESRVAFHHGGLPQEIQFYIIDLFNKKKLKAVFCTSTIIEGVNLEAKNVIIYRFQDKIGRPKMTYLEYKNLVGRAGRLGKYFAGNIYFKEKDFSKQVEKKKEINIKLNEYSDIKDIETIIQMKVDDQKTEDVKKLKDEDILKKDLDIIKRNRFIGVKGQKVLLKKLRDMSDDDFLDFENFSFSKNDEDEESSVSKVINESRWLFSDEHRKKVFRNVAELRENGTSRGNSSYTIPQLAFYYSRYIRSFEASENAIKSLYPAVYMNNRSEFEEGNKDVGKRISKTSKLVNNFCSFALPRYIKAFFIIYEHVYKERTEKELDNKVVRKYLDGDTENTPKNLLKALDVPNNIIGDIIKYFENCKDTLDIRKKFKEEHSIIKDELSREKLIFLEYIMGYSNDDQGES